MRRGIVGILLAVAVLAAGAASSASAGLPSTWRQGVNVTAYWWEDLQAKRLDPSLRAARSDVHAEEVTFVVPGFQYDAANPAADPLQATQIHASPGTRRSCAGKSGRDWRRCKTPRTAALRAAIARARRTGLTVRLRPQVDVGAGETTMRPRELIDHGTAEGRDAWFRTYRAWLRPYAALARDARVDTFIFGTGLTGMTDDEDDRAAWRALIADIRSGALAGDGRGGYAGELTYSAMWDSIVEDAMDPATKLFFWDDTDIIGIDAFFPLAAAGARDPSVTALRLGWSTRNAGMPASPVDLVRRLRAEYGKDVWFTALGYLSRRGTAAAPERYDANVGPRSQRPQARGVAAAFEAWVPIAREGWFRGISWWDWPAAARPAARDGSHSLRGKQAQLELCRRHAPSVRTAGRCRLPVSRRAERRRTG